MLHYVVVVQFLCGIFPLAEMAGSTLFLPQLFALHLSTLLELWHPPCLNQSVFSSLPIASSRPSLVILAFSCHSLQDLRQPSKHYHQPSSAHVITIQLHSLLLTHLQFPSNPTCPSILQSSFCLQLSDRVWLSP